MSKRPNILVFLTDDHGQWAANCYGTRELHTPNLNHLARHGVRMDRAFTPCPVCSPARASFFTGRTPSQHGVHDFLSAKTAPNHPAIAGQTNIGQLLQAGGYETAMIGKWHVGSTDVHPGFDVWCPVSQGPHFGDVTFMENGQAAKQRGPREAMVTDRLIQFLRQRDGQRPFFAFVGYTATHSPFDGHRERLVEHYRQCTFDAIPDETPEDRFRFHRRTRSTPQQDRERLAQYYASVSTIDEQVGRVIDELDAHGLREQTLIVYTSDHGHMNGHHGLWCKGNATVPQNFYEESVLVPCIVSWPGMVPEGQDCDALVDTCDLYATVLDAAQAQPGAELGGQINSPGRSYLPLISGQDSAWRDVVYCEYGNARMARSQRYKLIRRYPGPNGHFGDEVYDLETDPRERCNVIGDSAMKDVVADLGRRLDQHFARYQVPGRSGDQIMDQPMCNLGEPWRFDGTQEGI
jgi:choline-sulfatase